MGRRLRPVPWKARTSPSFPAASRTGVSTQRRRAQARMPPFGTFSRPAARPSCPAAARIIFRGAGRPGLASPTRDPCSLRTTCAPASASYLSLVSEPLASACLQRLRSPISMARFTTRSAPGCAPLATFRDFYGHGRLFIDNPLSERRSCIICRAASRPCGPKARAETQSCSRRIPKWAISCASTWRWKPTSRATSRSAASSSCVRPSTAFPLQSPAASCWCSMRPRTFCRARGVLLTRANISHPSCRGAYQGAGRCVADAPGSIHCYCGRHRRSRASPSRGFEQRLDRVRASTLEELLTRASECDCDGPRIAASFAAIASHACMSWSNPPERRPAELLLELELALLSWKRGRGLQRSTSPWPSVAEATVAGSGCALCARHEALRTRGCRTRADAATSRAVYSSPSLAHPVAARRRPFDSSRASSSPRRGMSLSGTSGSRQFRRSGGISRWSSRTSRSFHI